MLLCGLSLLHASNGSIRKDADGDASCLELRGRIVSNVYVHAGLEK